MAAIAIIGGGVIGCAAAAWLAADGHEVTVFERRPEDRHASAGNAGLLAFPEITPLARPGVLRSVPRWLMDPLGPLALRWRDLPALTPWLLRFLAAARAEQVERSTAALGGLMRSALEDHHELARRAGLSGHLRQTGAIDLYDTEASFRAALPEWELRRRLGGHDFKPLTPDQARELVPDLNGGFARAVLCRAYWMVDSPLGVLQGLRRTLGDRLVTGAVAAVEPGADGITVRLADGSSRAFDKVVVSAGVWSRDIVRGLGLKMPLETERGYNTTIPEAPVRLPMPVVFADHGFVASPLADGLRIGGAVELAAVDAPANLDRARALRRKARAYLPAIPETGGTEWMGCRPSTPDSLPVIGPDPRDRRIVLAFGHGHLGLTLSATTARLAAGLLSGTPAPAAFGIDRFQ
ncbi:FAD-binding oxidoreductase [Inquilinus sp. Marseille-Q2685]|uniref:NAD(P)/FAD-dependent oxidoreductase n=1 Tax=Inquilinus sp. Marseille-Q2685 TaxID=2866581 RepID=UPI001CE43868|nr:FAD-dependent oxidoreductase [Inquilinus sp. Marseille-Q2685]